MKISIVTITFNRAHLIGDTIQSVLNQTYKDFEYIIIDDGSTDDTEAVIKGFDDDRIHYHKYEKNGWRSYLRNEGFRKANGELISVLDSDDIWTADKLEIIISIFNENPTIGFVVHNLSIVNKNGTENKSFLNYESDFKGFVFDDLLNNKIVPYPIFTIKRTVFQEMGFLNEDLVDGQHDLYLRITSNHEIYYCAKKLTFMRKHEQNISSKKDVTHYKDYLTSLDNLKNQDLISEKKYIALSKKIKIVMAKHYLRKLNLVKALEILFLYPMHHNRRA